MSNSFYIPYSELLVWCLRRPGIAFRYTATSKVGPKGIKHGSKSNFEIILHDSFLPGVEDISHRCDDRSTPFICEVLLAAISPPGSSTHIWWNLDYVIRPLLGIPKYDSWVSRKSDRLEQVLQDALGAIGGLVVGDRPGLVAEEA